MSDANSEDMAPEYDFSDAQRNPYAKRYAEGVNIVKLDPDVAAAFPNAAAVNEALRACLKLTESIHPQHPTKRSA